MIESIGFKTDERKIAYFSMEIGIQSDIPTYSGGLGVLAGDTLKSFADLNIPAIAVTLLYRKGYFHQVLDDNGKQYELPVEWNPENYMKLLPNRVTVHAHGRPVIIQAWQYTIRGRGGYDVPIIFLDTDLEQNDAYDRTLSHYLYGGDNEYRLSQEIILGIGGMKMLVELGYTQLNRYHMNEGHAALLALELLKEKKGRNGQEWDVAGVRELCVFTTHTPVPAGRDKFEYGLVERVMDSYIPLDILKQHGGENELNMTLLAMNLSHYVNGVAQKHSEVSREMFPGYRIDSITNGVHAESWTSGHFKDLFSRFIPGWVEDPFTLRYVLKVPLDRIWGAHMDAKRSLLSYIKSVSGVDMDKEVFTVGFARRATAYKRADLIFQDTERLLSISRKAGKMQFVFSGKAHPRDSEGKEIIEKIAFVQKELGDSVKIVYLGDYSINLAKIIVAGVDLWLNTPCKPQEASGTSGMKAALNGVPSFSILDGWWVEGCLEGLTGWAIDTQEMKESSDENDSHSMYDKLENVIIPLYYKKREEWIAVMRNSIAINGSFYNAHRMALQYVLNAYFLLRPYISERISMVVPAREYV